MKGLCVALLAAAPALVDAHGNMLYPPAWWDANASVTLTPGASCAPGCGQNVTPAVQTGCANFCMWFSDGTSLDDGTGVVIRLTAAPDVVNVDVNDGSDVNEFETPFGTAISNGGANAPIKSVASDTTIHRM